MRFRLIGCFATVCALIELAHIRKVCNANALHKGFYGLEWLTGLIHAIHTCNEVDIFHSLLSFAHLPVSHPLPPPAVSFVKLASSALQILDGFVMQIVIVLQLLCAG